jgi:hypothetical protein
VASKIDERTAECQRHTRWCLCLRDYAVMRISHPSGSRQPGTCSQEQDESSVVTPGSYEPQTRLGTRRRPSQRETDGSPTQGGPSTVGVRREGASTTRRESKGRRQPCQSNVRSSRPASLKTSIAANTVASGNGQANRLPWIVTQHQDGAPSLPPAANQTVEPDRTVPGCA